jgi:hypothetical protein
MNSRIEQPGATSRNFEGQTVLRQYAPETSVPAAIKGGTPYKNETYLPICTQLSIDWIKWI